jgi:hypothetical protein
MFADMAVTVEVHHTTEPEMRAEVVAVIEHVLADRAGDWRVSIIASQANDRCPHLEDLQCPNRYTSYYDIYLGNPTSNVSSGSTCCHRSTEGGEQSASISLRENRNDDHPYAQLPRWEVTWDDRGEFFRHLGLG